MPKFSTKKYLKEKDRFIYMRVREPVLLKNGKRISIQQSSAHYCGKDTCEVYYPDEEEPKGYQTYEEIDNYVNKHGGIA